MEIIVIILSVVLFLSFVACAILWWLFSNSMKHIAELQMYEADGIAMKNFDTVAVSLLDLQEILQDLVKSDSNIQYDPKVEALIECSRNSLAKIQGFYDNHSSYFEEIEVQYDNRQE